MTCSLRRPLGLRHLGLHAWLALFCITHSLTEATSEVVTWLIICDMTHYMTHWVWRAWLALLCITHSLTEATNEVVTRLIICDMTHYMTHWVWRAWLALNEWSTTGMTHGCVTWLMDVWHDSWMCDMTHGCVTWLMDVCPVVDHSFTHRSY